MVSFMQMVYRGAASSNNLLHGMCAGRVGTAAGGNAL